MENRNVPWQTLMVRYLNENQVPLPKTAYDEILTLFKPYEHRQYFTSAMRAELQFRIRATYNGIKPVHVDEIIALALGFDSFAEFKKSTIHDMTKRKPRNVD